MDHLYPISFPAPHRLKAASHHNSSQLCRLVYSCASQEKGRHNPAILERPLLTSALPTGKHLMKRRSAQIMSTERRECGCSWWDVPCAASCAWEAAQQAAAWIAEQAHTAAVALAEVRHSSCTSAVRSRVLLVIHLAADCDLFYGRFQEVSGRGLSLMLVRL